MTSADHGTTAGTAVLLTGASRGIGLALANGLAEAGMRVAAMGRGGRPSDDALDAKVMWLRGDVRSDADCARVVRQCAGSFGKISALINNAALGMGHLRQDADDAWNAETRLWGDLFDTNLVGVFRMTREVRPIMRRQGFGHVINISTGRATMVLPTMCPYGAAKAALEAMTAAWARELAPEGIRVNVALPGGPCQTEMITTDRGLSIPTGALLPSSIMNEPIRWLLEDAPRDLTGIRVIGRHWPHEPLAIGSQFAAEFPVG